MPTDTPVDRCKVTVPLPIVTRALRALRNALELDETTSRDEVWRQCCEMKAVHDEFAKMLEEAQEKEE